MEPQKTIIKALDTAETRVRQQIESLQHYLDAIAYFRASNKNFLHPRSADAEEDSKTGTEDWSNIAKKLENRMNRAEAGIVKAVTEYGKGIPRALKRFQDLIKAEDGCCECGWDEPSSFSRLDELILVEKCSDQYPDGEIVVHCQKCFKAIPGTVIQDWLRHKSNNELEEAGIDPRARSTEPCDVCGESNAEIATLDCHCKVCTDCVRESAVVSANRAAREAKAEVKFSCPKCTRTIPLKTMADAFIEKQKFSNVMRVFTLNGRISSEHREYCCVHCMRNVDKEDAGVKCKHLIFCQGCAK